MTKVTIELPASVTFSNKAHGKLSVFKTEGLAASVIEAAAMLGFKTSILNAYNSVEGSHAVKLAAMQKRIATIASGEWTATERGEALFTTYRDEVFIPYCMEQGLTMKQAEQLIRQKVKDSFPPETKATFANFIEATAIERESEFGGDRQAARDAIDQWYESQLETRRAAQAKAGAKVAMPTIDLGAFKKPAKK
jgi:hypothetical protein